MFKITDVLTLGTDYTVANPSGGIVGTIQVIPFKDLLDATLGPYTEEFGEYQAYIDKSIATLSGFDDVDPNRVLWYATSESEVSLSEIIEYAITNGYNKIILEYLEELE